MTGLVYCDLGLSLRFSEGGEVYRVLCRIDRSTDFWYLPDLASTFRSFHGFSSRAVGTALVMLRTPYPKEFLDTMSEVDILFYGGSSILGDVLRLPNTNEVVLFPESQMEGAGCVEEGEDSAELRILVTLGSERGQEFLRFEKEISIILACDLSISETSYISKIACGILNKALDTISGTVASTEFKNSMESEEGNINYDIRVRLPKSMDTRVGYRGIIPTAFNVTGSFPEYIFKPEIKL